MNKHFKIYVAARFEEYRRVLKFQKRLQGLGHRITCDWALHALEHPDYFKEKPQGIDRQLIAISELSGVQRCDLFFVFPHPEGASAYAETTLAVALGKTVCAISEIGAQASDRTFLHHPDILWLWSEDEAVKALRDGEIP